MRDHGETGRLQKECLTLRDCNDRTVLDYSRMAGKRDLIQGGEDIIVAAMKTRPIPITAQTRDTQAPVHDSYISVPFGRPRVPTTEPPAEPAYGHLNVHSSTSP